MDPLTSPGGYLGAFVLAGILLPIAVSFVLDGVVMYFRGRGIFRLAATASLTIALVGLYTVVAQNAFAAGEGVALSGALGAILWVSIPAAALGFGVRMIALFLNPTTRAVDQAAIEQRKARHSARTAARTVVATTQAHGVTRHA
jgi:hypothetical protein